MDVEDQMEQIFYDFASRIKKNFIPTSRRISRQDIPRSLCSEVIHLLTHVYLDFWSVISPVQKTLHTFWEISCSSSYILSKFILKTKRLLGCQFLLEFLRVELTRIDTVYNNNIPLSNSTVFAQCQFKSTQLMKIPTSIDKPLAHSLA